MGHALSSFMNEKFDFGTLKLSSTTVSCQLASSGEGQKAGSMVKRSLPAPVRAVADNLIQALKRSRTYVSRYKRRILAHFHLPYF